MFNSKTGIISGKPTSICEKKEHIVKVKSSSGVVTETKLSISGNFEFIYSLNS